MLRHRAQPLLAHRRIRAHEARRHHRRGRRRSGRGSPALHPRRRRAGRCAHELAGVRPGRRPGLHGAVCRSRPPGHLILVPWLFDWTYLEAHPDFNQTFDVALHVGTLVAVVAYFWREIGELIVAWWRSVRARAVRDRGRTGRVDRDHRNDPRCLRRSRSAKAIENGTSANPWQIAIFLAIGALVLYAVDRRPSRRTRTLPTLRSVRPLLGVAQTLSLAPGVSRSGIVITDRAPLRLDRDSAATDLVLPARPGHLWRSVYQGA